jgi:hypothetical protein
MRWVLLASALAVCVPAFGKSPSTARDPRTIGLGNRCDKRKDCKGKGQTCLRPVDARGKPQAHGFCALPCASLDSGLSKPAAVKRATREQSPPDAGTAAPRSPADAGAVAAPAAKPSRPAAAASSKRNKVPPRCPPHFQCRGAGYGVPIDLCVRD